MNKEMLVIENPSNCGRCPCCMLGTYGCYCTVNGKEVDHDDRPDWCPLRKFPEKLFDADLYDEYDTGYQHGWNACLKEIIGE